MTPLRVLAASGSAALILSACSPAWPDDPAAYVPTAVGDAAVVDSGVAVERYGQLFADTADCPRTVAVAGPGNDDGSSRPAAVVVVCEAVSDDAFERLRELVVRGSDTPTSVSLEGESVESAQSPMPGGGSPLDVRIWRPEAGIVVVVIGFDGAAGADSAVGAVIATARGNL